MHKTAKSKPTSNELKEEICFIFKMHYSLEQKKVDEQSISCQTIDKKKGGKGVTLFRGSQFLHKK